MKKQIRIYPSERCQELLNQVDSQIKNSKATPFRKDGDLKDYLLQLGCLSFLEEQK